MTTQDAMLKLARAVYGESAYLNTTDLREGCQGVFVQCRAMWGKFDPANNDSQAVAVLCWLLQRDYKRNSDKAHHVTPNDVGEYNIDADDFFAICRQPHQRTPASFRAAVTKAALRVVG